jgi:arsenite oxidase small subunit
MMKEKKAQKDMSKSKPCEGWCASRRQFLVGAGTGAISAVLLPVLLKEAQAQPVEGRLTGYPRKLVARISELKQDEPVRFRYPQDHPNCDCFIVKLGVPAMGGVGPEKDIVAFSSYCTHMGGVLMGKTKARQKYRADTKILGPCPVHLSSFDLTKGGIITSAHATQKLPQIILETQGDEIYATGVVGLIYGLHDNLAKLPAVKAES